MASSYKPHWKGPAPFPEIEVQAKPHGGLQWECPNCGNLHNRDAHFWRRAQIRCRRLGCQRRFRVGVGFIETIGPRPATCHLAGTWKLNYGNRINPPESSPWRGRVFGAIDWCCPKCNTFNESMADFFQPSLTCTSCTSSWWISLLIYTPSGSKNITPYDWVPYAPKTHDPLSTSQADRSLGESK
jgi:rubredoxin